MNWKSKEYWIVITLLILTGIYVNIIKYSRIAVTETVELAAIPSYLSEWKTDRNISMDEQTLNELKSDQYIWRKYSDNKGKQISLFIGYFKDQKYGSQIHSPKHCLPGGGWKIVDKNYYSIQIADTSNQTLTMNKMINSNGRHNELMFYWYWTRSGIITSEYGLKLDLAKNALLRKPTDAAFIRINLPLDTKNPEESHAFAQQFIQSFFQSINESLPFNNI